MTKEQCQDCKFHGYRVGRITPDVKAVLDTCAKGIYDEDEYCREFERKWKFKQRTLREVWKK
jgi:hypothetical protein